MLTTPHKYPFAINDNGKPIYIDDVTQENRRHTHYHCYGCGAELFPVLGDERKHHFRHEKDAICDPDKYLHEYAKAAIKSRFEESDVYEVAYRAKKICNQKEKCQFAMQFNWQECESEEGLYKVNLKEYYDTCLEEKGYYQTLSNGKKKYIADLILLNSKDPSIPHTCIEIWVTHECTEDKKVNGGRIIEVKILEEKDAVRPLVESDDEVLPIRFFNFQREVPVESSKTFKHIKLLPGLKGRVVVTDESSCKEGLVFDHKASHEIILHDVDKLEVQELVFAYYCNKHGQSYPEQILCANGNYYSRGGQNYLRCPFINSERRCPCRQFKYSAEKADQYKGFENFYWTKESTELANTKSL